MSGIWICLMPTFFHRDLRIYTNRWIPCATHRKSDAVASRAHDTNLCSAARCASQDWIWRKEWGVVARRGAARRRIEYLSTQWRSTQITAHPSLQGAPRRCHGRASRVSNQNVELVQWNGMRGSYLKWCAGMTNALFLRLSVTGTLETSWSCSCWG